MATLNTNPVENIREGENQPSSNDVWRQHLRRSFASHIATMASSNNLMASTNPNISCRLCRASKIHIVLTTSCGHSFCHSCVAVAVVNSKCVICLTVIDDTSTEFSDDEEFDATFDDEEYDESYDDFDLTDDEEYDDEDSDDELDFELSDDDDFDEKVTDDTKILECKICMTNKIRVALVKCGHTFCNSCTKKFNHRCAQCRTTFDNSTKIQIFI